MGERVLVDLLQVPMAMIDMNVIGGLTHLITEGFDIGHGRGILRFYESDDGRPACTLSSNLCDLCALCG